VATITKVCRFYRPFFDLKLVEAGDEMIEFWNEPFIVCLRVSSSGCVFKSATI